MPDLPALARRGVAHAAVSLAVVVPVALLRLPDRPPLPDLLVLPAALGLLVLANLLVHRLPDPASLDQAFRDRDPRTVLRTLAPVLGRAALLLPAFVTRFLAVLLVSTLGFFLVALLGNLPLDAHPAAVNTFFAAAIIAGTAWGCVGLVPTAPDSDALGSARFADAREMQDLLDGRDDAAGLLIGRDPRSGRLLRYRGPAHLLTIAPTRAGKGVGAIIPNLLLARRPVLCIDPKGENARLTAAARERFGPVHVLDPFAASGCPAAACNPMDVLDPASPDLAEDAATLADALVADPPGTAQDPHWNEEAKALLAGLLMLVACHEEPERRTLATVRDHLTLPPGAFRELLAIMQASTAAGGLVARAANRQLGKAEREASGVLSAAQRHTHFLDSPRIAAATGRSDLQLAELKQTGPDGAVTTLFLVLPPERLDAYGRWLRLLVAQAITALARARTASTGSAPVLFLLDEFAALGRLEPVARAMGLLAGYGLQLWPILQDLAQLRAIYGQSAGTFIANAGVLQAFAVNDPATARWLADTLGEGTVAYETAGRSRPDNPFAKGSSRTSTGHLAPRKLLTPDEIMRLPPGHMLLHLQGRRPLLATRLRSYTDPEFQGLFDPARP